MPDLDLNKIGLTLKSRRVDMKLSLRDLAEHSGIAARTISQIETGKGSPNIT